MDINKVVNREFLTNSALGRWLLPLVAISLVLAANVMVFTQVPNERVMGAVQRIFYFHVGSAMASYVMVAIVFLASVLFLATRSSAWDLLAQASANIALLFCLIVLLTGCIWGHAAWNTWWRWEPRLVSFLILTLLCFSYVILRKFSSSSEQNAVFAAVLGILVAINVPVVIFSIKFVDQLQQLHPQVVAKQGLRDTSYIVGFVISNLAAISLSLWMMWLKLTNLVLARDVREAIIEKQIVEEAA